MLIRKGKIEKLHKVEMCIEASLIVLLFINGVQS